MWGLRDLEKRIRVRLVTGEFEIIAALYLYGAMPSRDLARHSKSSAANFQIILRRLRDEQVLVCTRCPTDGRVRKYDLSEHVRQHITLFLGASASNREASGGGRRPEPYLVRAAAQAS